MESCSTYGPDPEQTWIVAPDGAASMADWMVVYPGVVQLLWRPETVAAGIDPK